MKKASIVLAVLATTLASTGALVQGQENTAPQAQESGVPQAPAQKGTTVGGHIGFVLPLMTHSGGQTIDVPANQFAIGFPVGITVKGSGRMAFDLELVPQINTSQSRLTTLTVHPG